MADSLFTSNSDAMKKLLLRIIFILLVVVAVDCLVGALSDKYLSRGIPLSSEEIPHACYSLTQASADLLIVGSSEAMTDYNTWMLRDSLGLDVYDAGMSNRDMLFDLAVIRASASRRAPKIILLDLNKSALGGDAQEMMANLYFLYGKNPYLTEVLDSLVDRKTKWLLNSALYRWNSSLPWIIRSKVEKESSLEEMGYGFRPWPDSYPDLVPVVEDTPFVADAKEYTALCDAVLFCQENGIQLIITIAPALVDDRTGFVPFLTEFAARESIPLWDFSTLCEGHPEWFKDNVHLNYDGSVVYTEALLNRLYGKE